MMQENEDVFMEWLLEKGEEHGIDKEQAVKAVTKVAPHTLFKGEQRAEYDATLAELEGCIDLLIEYGMPSANLIRLRNKLPQIVAESINEQIKATNVATDNKGGA